MNTETGQIYRGEREVKMAEDRGEPIVALTEQQADLLEKLGKLERRRAWAERWYGKGAES